MRFFGVALVAAVVGFSGIAAAQEVTVIGTHGKWTAFRYTENKQPVCYMAAEPDKAEGNYRARGEILLLVTHRPADKAFDVINMVAGYQYKADTDALVNIGSQRYELFTVGSDRAWARDSKTDRAIIQAMIKGSTAVIRGTSSRGTVTTDTFSLIGFTAAYQAISEACKKPA